MSKTELELKSVGQILKENFYIPSYQRGYRWDNQQVEDLLNDIYEFSQNRELEDEFYCLQPIVVLEDENHHRVIDGQQRLTTIYIILKYLEEDISDTFITYETREEKNRAFFKNILSHGLNYDNPDFYYMSSGYQTIKEWFKETYKEEIFIDTLLNYVKVIWYEVQAESLKKEIEVFTRLNIGKIPLTNAELIKAMFLVDIKEYKSQIEFSIVWDKIELRLQNSEFWYFVSNNPKATTAIDIIFEVLAEQYNVEFKFEISKKDDKFSFYVFDKILKENRKSRAEIWKESQEIYRYFIDWYNNREIYHKVGFLINFNHDLVDLIREYRANNKNIFIELLNKKLQLNVNLEELIFKNKTDIHKTLLLFNLETIQENKNSNSRFPFDKYKNEKWDIEHIASQTDNSNKKEWIKTIYRYIVDREIDKSKVDKLEKKFERFNALVKKRLNIKELNEELKDNIGNLTLLNSKINRSYGNAFFPIKRAIIIDEDSKGSFIPIATKNIFLKQYSKRLSDMMNWTENDILSYRDKIAELLKDYGVKNAKSGE